MAVLTGTSVESPIGGTCDNISADVDNHDVDYYPFHDIDLYHAGGSSTLTDNVPVDPYSWSITGILAHSYRLDYYDHIHILPNPLAMGAVAATAQRDVEVWNAFLNTEALGSIVGTNDDGITLANQPTPPTTYQPLESRVYQVTVSADGNPVIDADLAFMFASEQPVLNITGSRALIMPYSHNWKVPIPDRYEYKTNVLLSDDGSEQRIKLRKYPRRFVEYQYTVEGTNKQKIKTSLWQAQKRTNLIPLYMDLAISTAESPAAGFYVYCTTAWKGWAVGGLAIITHGGEQEVFEIVTWVADRLTTKYALINTWPAGSKIYPARLALISPNQPAPSQTSRVMSVGVRYEIIDETVENLPTLTPDTYDYYSEDVYPYKPNWREPLDMEFVRLIERLDNQTGYPRIVDSHDMQYLVERLLQTKRGVEDTRELVSWFVACAGRQVSFWLPTLEADLTVNDDISNIDTVIKINNIGYAEILEEGRNDIMIMLKDQTRFYRHVTLVGEVDDYTESVTIDSALGQAVTTSEIAFVCWLQKVRYASDAAEFTWHTPELMETTLSVQGIPGD